VPSTICEADQTVFRLLHPDEAPAIVALEKAAWPLPLQADAATIARRFTLGHYMMGAWREARLIGLGSYVLTHADPHDEAVFPRTFGEFSSLARTDPPRSAYTYNLCIDPAFRSLELTAPMVAHLLGHAASEGCQFAVGDGRCPSYDGSTERPDRVRQNPRFRALIDAWHSSGRRPTDEEMILDPVLRFYWRITRCRFLHLRPRFLPGDTASGGFRVIFVIDLAKYARNTQR
jgi:hypothetical protein